MKHIITALRGICLLLVFAPMLAARPSPASHVTVFGMNAEVPESWNVRKGAEQVLIYNKSESSAVIVDQVEDGGGNSARTVAEKLADAVGVDKKDIAADGAGGLSMTFTHSGEAVDVRVFEDKGRVVMVYAFGADDETRRIARSIGAPASAPQAATRCSPGADAEKQ